MSTRSSLLRKVALGSWLLSMAAAPSAFASNPSATYVVPTKVELLPDAATANRVVIHGAFFFYQTGGSYGSPSCGYMYFQCPAGSEAMCRMQWNDINTAIGMPQCMGFGPQNMASKATLRSEGTALGNPDTWDLGIGVSPGFFVGGQCAPAQALKCPLPSPPDMAPPPPVPDMAVVSPPNPPPPAGGGSSSSGCAMGSSQGALGGASLLLASVVASLLRSRRRRQ